MEAVELKKIVEEMKSPRPFVRGRAVDALMRVRDEAAIPVLFKLVQKEMDFIKVNFCRFLGKVRSPAGVAPLVSLLLGPSEKVAAEATFALDRIDHDKKTEALMYLLGEKNHFAKVYAIKALAAEKKIKAVPLLIDALPRENPEMRELVIDALRQIADPAAIAPLMKLLPGADKNTLYAALYALGEIGERGTAPPLFPYLQHEDPDIRRAAVWALARLKCAGAVPAFLDLLKNDPSDEVREEVCRRLAALGGRKAVKPLLFACARDRSNNVRKYAGWALQEIPLPEKREVLLRFKDDQDKKLREVALFELGVKPK
ncbi:MAG: HEAT repeat domain-containing protein [Candidatus Omnitrophota bacterium]